MGCAPSKPIAAGAAVAALPLSSSRHLVDSGKLNGAARTSARSTTASTTASTTYGASSRLGQEAAGRQQQQQQQQLQKVNPPAGKLDLFCLRNH